MKITINQNIASEIQRKVRAATYTGKSLKTKAFSWLPKMVIASIVFLMVIPFSFPILSMILGG